jgi:hypothetical protein
MRVQPSNERRRGADLPFLLIVATVIALLVFGINR